MRPRLGPPGPLLPRELWDPDARGTLVTGRPGRPSPASGRAVRQAIIHAGLDGSLTAFLVHQMAMAEPSGSQEGAPVTIMDTNEYALEVIAQCRLAEMRATAERLNQIRAESHASPRRPVPMGDALIRMRDLLLSVRSMLW